MRSPRLDLVIATIALLVSAGATASSIYQTHVIANQLSASVWPYLAIQSDTTTNQSWRLSVTNDGLGPALIESAALEIDGKNVRRYRDGFEALHVIHVSRREVSMTSSSSIGASTVVRAGETAAIIAITGPFVAKLGDLGSRVKLSFCYCSLLDQCWTVRSKEARRTVAGCDDHRVLDF